MFLYGACGSAAVEIVNLVAAFSSGRAIPARYRSKGFWFVRFLLVLVGGILAVAYDVHSNILAIHIGASAPLIINNMRSHLPESVKGDEQEEKKKASSP
jgi:hypothetical protein